MAKTYGSREFCKHIKCAVQVQIDTWGLTEPEIKRAKTKCKDCMAYKFHQYLKDNNYVIANFGKPLVEEEKG